MQDLSSRAEDTGQCYCSHCKEARTRAPAAGEKSNMRLVITIACAKQNRCSHFDNGSLVFMVSCVVKKGDDIHPA